METPTSSIITTGDLGGRKVGMEIDSSAMAHIMSILTDLYSDPELAVIREYSTNALDAHVEAGNKAPIQVFTPSALSPYFKIKDFGIGLSVDDIVSMYSKYGASTKRGTNDQVGMLGLGAKSALTLVPQFSLTSVKDGVRIVVSVSRAADGSGQMEIIDTKATDEPNGVEVSIPVPRSHNFAGKCRNFFRFWKQGTVLVDGKEPEFITGRPVGDKFIINNELSQDYVVMGNVAYPVKEGLYAEGYSHRQLGIVAFVNIGDVNFTPSREHLHYTPKTKETIRELQKEFSTKLIKAAQEDISGAPSYAEAWKRSKQWKTSFYGRLGDFTYKDHKIPSDIPLALDPNSQYGQSTIQGKQVEIFGRNSRYASWVRSINPTMLDSFMFVTGFADSLKISPTQREKAQIYAQQQGWSIDKVVLFRQDQIITNTVHLAFLEGIKIVKWEDIAKIKITRARGTRVVKTDPYDLYTGSWSYIPTSTIDTSKEIVFISPAENKRPDFLNTIFPDAQIVMLGMNRWDKFKRDFPTAKHYEKAISDYRAALEGKLTRSDKILLTNDMYSRRPFENLAGFQIDDPDVAEYVKILTDKTAKLSDAAKALKNMPRSYSTFRLEGVESPLTKYPLAGNISHEDKNHAVWYINSYYAHLNKKEN
jgi:hypothetical protein